MNLRCLIVDDEPNAVSLLEMLIGQNTSWQLLGKCYDAREALAFLKTNPNPTVNLIFLDINMPVLNGFQTLRKLKADKRFRHIPVVIYSTSIQPQEEQQAVTLGALQCVKKPSTLDELCRFLSAFLQSPD